MAKADLQRVQAVIAVTERSEIRSSWNIKHPGGGLSLLEERGLTFIFFPLDVCTYKLLQQAQNQVQFQRTRSYQQR